MEAGAATSDLAFSSRSQLGPAAPSSIVLMTLREGRRRLALLLLKAATRLRRLLAALARHPSYLLNMVLHVRGSLAKLVRLLLSTRPARLLVAAAASLICITLQYHRPLRSSVHLSSSISLLFGIVKLQGSLAVQLGPPEPSHAAHPPAEQQEELRINCPKDLKESIVRFLESQAARNHAGQPAWQLSTPTRDLTAVAVAPPPPPRAEEPDPLQLLDPQLPASAALVSENAAAKYADSLMTVMALSEAAAATATAAAGAAAAAYVNAEAETASEPPSALSYGDGPSYALWVEAQAVDGCAGDKRWASPATSALSTAVMAGPGAAGPASTAPYQEALLPSTPPLGCSPPAKAACLAADGPGEEDGTMEAAAGGHLGSSGMRKDVVGAHPPVKSLYDPAALLATLGPTQEPASLDRSDYQSLLSYAKSYKSSVAPMESPRAAMATHGSSAGFYDLLSNASSAGSLSEAAGAAASVTPAAGGAAAARGRSGAGTGLHKSPDSILGLRKLGLEGWTESTRRWESRYLEELE